MKTILNIRNLTSDDTEQAGQKAVGLAQLKDFNIVPGYVVTADVFDNFIEHNQLKGKIRNLLAIVDPNDEARLNDVSNELQNLIVNGKIPDEVMEHIVEAYYSLNIKEGAPIGEMMESESEPDVIVRSSPLKPGESNMSILSVTGKEKLLKAVVACYASMFSVEQIRKRHNEEHRHIAMPVIIQKMLLPKISGTLARDQDIVVKACFGLGDENTSHDKYTVSNDLEVKSVVVERQKTAYMKDPEADRLAKIELPEIQADNQKLNDKQVLVLAQLYAKANMPEYEIEYIVDKETYYFTQVKPAQKVEESASETAVLETAPQEPIAQEPDAEQQPVETEEPVQMEESEDIVHADAEPETEEAPSEKKEDALFNIFNKNREDAPEVPEPTEQAEPEEEAEMEETAEPMAEPDAEEPAGVEASDEPEEPKELDEQEFSAPPSDTVAQEGEPVPATKSDIHPLSKQEWLSTIALEHTKMVLSYDAIMQEILSKKYKALFGAAPADFETMLDGLEERNTLMHEEEIRRIRAIRNDFLNDHTVITMADLREANEAINKIINSY